MDAVMKLVGRLRWPAAALAAAVLAACGGGGTDAAGVAAEPVDVGAPSGPAQAPAARVPQPADPTGRLLASNCFQCHGTGGTGGFDRIRGGDAAETVEFLRRPAGSSIMAAHAQGYTREQLEAIVAYLRQP